MRRLLFFTIIIFITPFIAAEPTAENLLAKLAEAKDYLRVKPSVTANILKEHLSEIGKLSIEEQLSWHQNLLRASISQNDLTQVETTARAMLDYPDLIKRTDKFVSLLSSLGIYLRRKGHPKESIWLFDCGLNQPIKNEKQKISLLLSKGNSLSYLDNNIEAKASYAQALQIAKQINAKVYKSAIGNTLGIMAIKEGEYALAKEYLVEALQISQDISRRSGQIVAGLQLLMLSVLSNDPMLYERLHYRISRLTLATNNESRHAYLFWIEKAHQVSNGQALSTQEQAELSKKLAQIKPVNIGLYNQLIEKFSTPLGVEDSPIVKKYSRYQGNLLNQIHQCKVKK